MGRLLPEDFDDATLRNDAERRVVRALAQDLSDEWLVLPSVAIPGDSRGSGKADYEIDVLLLHEHHGIVVVEVKGHEGQSIAIRGGKWSVGGRYLDPDPVSQVRSNAYALRDLLREVRPDLFKRLQRPAILVMMPNIAERPPGLERGVVVLTAQDLLTLGEAVREVENGQVLVNWGSAAAQAVLEIVAPSIDFAFDEDAQGLQRRQLLDNDSRARLDALAGLDVNRRVYVWGGPGTGKTWLAETWARRAVRDRQRTLLTCFNVPLAKALADRLADVSADATLLTIEPFLDFVAAGGAGIGPVPRSEGEDDTGYWNRVRQFIEDNAEHRSPLFDVIVIDEVQDIGDAWVRFLENLLDVDGKLLLLGDQTQRTIRDTVFTPPGPDEGFARCQLRVNLRNTKGIAQLLSTVFWDGAGRPRPGALPTLSIDYCAAADRDEAVDVVRRLLVDSAAAGVPTSRTAVLTTSAGWRDHLHDALGLRRWDVEGTGVLCETAQRVKGLEFDAVVLVGDGQMPRERLEALLLIGVSRAVSRLAVVGDEHVGALLRLVDDD